VQTNKDLDLPTQQELLAQFRCDEISAVALSEFNEQAKSQKRPVEAGKVVEGLGGMMRAWRTDALSTSDVPSIFSFAVNLIHFRHKLVTTATRHVITKVFMDANAPTSSRPSTPRFHPSSLAS